MKEAITAHIVVIRREHVQGGEPMIHFILYVCLTLSGVTLASLVVLLTKQITEYKRTDACLQTLRAEIRRTRLFHMRQRRNWRKSRQNTVQEKESDK